MALLILDTGVLIAGARGRVDVATLAGTDDVTIPAVAVAEYLAGRAGWSRARSRRRPWGQPAVGQRQLHSQRDSCPEPFAPRACGPSLSVGRDSLRAMTEPQDRDANEQTIGQTAVLLQQRERSYSTALMLDVPALDYEQDLREEDWLAMWVKLYVEPYLVSRFTDERRAEILDALNAVHDMPDGHITAILMREVLPEVHRDWRQRLAQELLAEQPSNQGLQLRTEPNAISRDGIYLTNREEDKVYAVLRDLQRTEPPDDTFLIAPLPTVLIPDRPTARPPGGPAARHPDFLITYRGRAGIIEVDGPHHHRGPRYATGVSRDAILLNAGIRHVGRIVVEDVTERSQVEQFIRAFLKRLAAL